MPGAISQSQAPRTFPLTGVISQETCQRMAGEPEGSDYSAPTHLPVSRPVPVERPGCTPVSLGCRTTSASRPTTVSRPLESADTAYMVVSLENPTKLGTEVTTGARQAGAIVLHPHTAPFPVAHPTACAPHRQEPRLPAGCVWRKRRCLASRDKSQLELPTARAPSTGGPALAHSAHTPLRSGDRLALPAAHRSSSRLSLCTAVPGSQPPTSAPFGKVLQEPDQVSRFLSVS